MSSPSNNDNNNNKTQKRKYSDINKQLRFDTAEPTIHNLEYENRKNPYIENIKKTTLIGRCPNDATLSTKRDFPCKRNNTIFETRNEYLEWQNETTKSRESYRMTHPEGPFKTRNEYKDYLRKILSIDIGNKTPKQIRAEKIAIESQPSITPPQPTYQLKTPPRKEKELDISTTFSPVRVRNMLSIYLNRESPPQSPPQKNGGNKRTKKQKPKKTKRTRKHQLKKKH